MKSFSNSNTGAPSWLKQNWILIFAGFVILVSYIKLFFGVDLADEGGYVSVSYSFVLGARPFYDEVTTTQNAGILLYPFLKLYSLVVPSVTGMILAVRHLYFLLSLYSARRLYLLIRPWLSRESSALISLLPMAFIFLSRPSICYNTMALFALLIGITSYFRLFSLAEKNPTPMRDATVGTLVFVAGAFSYPTFIVIAAPTILFTFFRLPKYLNGSQLKGVLTRIFAISIIGLIFAAGALWYAGMENIRNLTHYYQIFGTNFGGYWKFDYLMMCLRAYRAYGMVILACISAIWIGGFQNKFRWILLIPIFLGLFYAAIFRTEPPAPSLFLIVYLGLIPIPFLLPLKSFRYLFEMRVFWFLAFSAGSVFAWTSGIGLTSSTLGMVVATIINLICAALYLESKANLSQLLTFKFVTSGFVVFILVSCFVYFPQDGPLEYLSTRIESGAYAGLFTIPEKKELIKNLRSDLESQRPKAKSVMFFNDFPSGYLLTTLPRHSQSIWTPSVAPEFNELRRQNVLGYFDSPKKLPDLVVYMLSFAYLKNSMRTTPLPDAVLDFFSGPGYKLIIKRPEYYIFERQR